MKPQHTDKCWSWLICIHQVYYIISTFVNVWNIPLQRVTNVQSLKSDSQITALTEKDFMHLWSSQHYSSGLDMGTNLTVICFPYRYDLLRFPIIELPLLLNSIPSTANPHSQTLSKSPNKSPNPTISFLTPSETLVQTPWVWVFAQCIK